MATKWDKSIMPTVKVKVIPQPDQLPSDPHWQPPEVECELIGVDLDWYSYRHYKFRSRLLIRAQPDLLATGRDDLYWRSDEGVALPDDQLIVRETEVANWNMRRLYAESRNRGDYTFDED